jgi:hypothetical protein
MNELAIRQNTIPNAKSLFDLAGLGDTLRDLHSDLAKARSISRSDRQFYPRTAVEEVSRALNQAEQARGTLARFDAARAALTSAPEGEAYRANVSMQLASLLGSFPTVNIPDPKLFTRMLLDEVMAEEVNPIVLQAACQKIRRTQKFVPSISEILGAIAEQRKLWSDRVESADKIADLVEQLERERIELEALAAAEKVREEEALGHQRQAEAAFPVRTKVYHASHGRGYVTGHVGRSVQVNFLGSKRATGGTRGALASDLVRVAAMSGAPRIGQDIVHPWLGRGTIESIETDATMRITFDDGRTRSVPGDDQLWVIDEPCEVQP